MTDGGRLARRVAGFPTTVFSEFSALAAKHGAVNLGQGFPDFDGPEEIKEAAARAIREGVNQYAVGAGAADLRRAIAEHCRRFYRMEVDPETMITVTSGATEALFDAVMGLVNPGDEVVLFEPYYDSYAANVEMAGGVARYVELRPPDQAHRAWWFERAELEAAFTPRTRLVVVNTPHNPTGKVFTREELSLIARLCQERDAVALADEVYEHIAFEPARHLRLATLPGMADRTVTVSSGGKSFSFTGWKVGWAIAAPELRQAVQQAHQFVTFATASPLQAAIAAALRLPDGYFHRLASEYRTRRDRLVSSLAQAGLTPFAPEGTYFAMADCSAHGFEDDFAFCRWLTAEVGVAAIPPSAFYSEPHKAHARHLARFAFCKTDQVLEAAAERLARGREVALRGVDPDATCAGMARVSKARRTGAKVRRPAPAGGAALTPTYDGRSAQRIASEVERWVEGELTHTLIRAPARREQFTTDSGIDIPAVLTPADRSEERFEQLSLPGVFPYTRGIQPTMYRGRLWTMRQFAGFGSPQDTNRRFKYLIANGMTGLSTAFDMPALMGYDCDHPLSLGEVGKEGVAVSSLRDFEILFAGIDLGEVTTSMTINASAIVALCMYVAVAEKQGVPMERLGGTIQNDMLKEYIAQKEWIVPPRPAVRVVVDMIEFCAKRMPRWHPVSISGYHIREAGATAAQELAFTLADGIGYVEECTRRGLPVDSFAPRLSFFWDVHNDFFEEIAKFRAARRIWARTMRDRFGAKDPRSLQLKTHAQTAGVSLTAQQPYNNVVRTALQALAAVLGGTQSLHTNSLDETYALPTEEAVTLALRSQQIIAFESGVDRVVDPLAGSYYLEHLTDEMERIATDYIRRIDEMGGIIRAVEEGYPQREISESAYRFQREVEQRQRIVVGVNAFRAQKEDPIPTLKIDERVHEQQDSRLREVKASRSKSAVEAALMKVEAAARGSENLVPPVLEAVKAYATLGEICEVFRKVWGRYREGGAF